jgi:hypothetical protein
MHTCTAVLDPGETHHLASDVSFKDELLYACMRACMDACIQRKKVRQRHAPVRLYLL